MRKQGNLEREEGADTGGEANSEIEQESVIFAAISHLHMLILSIIWSILALSSVVSLKLSPNLSTNSYLGVYQTHRWSEEENRLLLHIRSRYIDEKTGRIKRGSWSLVVRELNAKIDANIEIYAAQHQADNLLKRHQQKELRQQSIMSEKPRKSSNWTPAYDEQLLSIRNSYLDESGTRVKTGSWPSIVSKANTLFPFTVTHTQCEKRVKDLLRKQEKLKILENHVKERIESEWSINSIAMKGLYEQKIKSVKRIAHQYPTRGWNSTAIYATTDSTLETPVHDRKVATAINADDGITVHSLSRAADSLYRPWTPEDSALLLQIVKEMDVEMHFNHIEQAVYDKTIRKIIDGITGMDTAIKSSQGKKHSSINRASKPRGYWVEVGNKLGRCSVQCANRYRWLMKINEPLFLSEEEEEEEE